MSKVISAAKAAELINDGATVASPTLGLTGLSEEVLIAVKNRYLESGAPKNITFVHGSGCGNWKDKGTHHLGYEGLVKRLICGHTGSAPAMEKLVEDNKAEAYILPQGVITHLYRAIAGHTPGVITKIGLQTFVDPRIEGGKASALTTEDLVDLLEINGEEWLLYKSFPIDVGLIRGTVADEDGNLTMENESILLEALPVATAARNSGGIVIAQVESVAKAKTLRPKDVKVPGVLVDYIVVSEPENHMQTSGTYYNPSFAGKTKIPLDSIKPLELDLRKIVVRRAAMELTVNAIVNLGVGMADGVAAIAAEEGINDWLTLTAESGVFGGVPATGLDFGSSYNCDAMIQHQEMFDFYDGGGLDITFLGLAQADKYGNTNVSKFGKRVMGCGGFINITQNAKKVVFCGSFTNGAKTSVKNGQIVIEKEGKNIKLMNKVDQITFSGKYAQQINQPVLYVTERAVFELTSEGLTLIELAPGIDLDTDVLAMMEFKPNISPDLKIMPKEIFQPKWGLLKEIVQAKHNSLTRIDPKTGVPVIAN